MRLSGYICRIIGEDGLWCDLISVSEDKQPHPPPLVSKLNQPLTPWVTPLWGPKMGLFVFLGLKTAANVFSLCEDRARLLLAETHVPLKRIRPLSFGGGGFTFVLDQKYVFTQNGGQKSIHPKKC